MSLFNTFFVMEDFWQKMQIPYQERKKTFEKYFGNKNLKIDNTDEAISYLRDIINNLQKEMVAIILSIIVLRNKTEMI